MISKEELKKLANILMFDMNDEEYDTLQIEFETMIKQMELINNIKGINEVEPLVFPFPLDEISIDNDVVENTITTTDALSNTKNVLASQVVVPKVVQE